MAKNKKRNTPRKAPMIFESLNYILLALGLFLVIAGFTVMYLENEVNGIISLYISPVVIMAGYVMVIFSILLHPSKDKNIENHSSA